MVLQQNAQHILLCRRQYEYDVGFDHFQQLCKAKKWKIHSRICCVEENSARGFQLSPLLQSDGSLDGVNFNPATLKYLNVTD